MKKILLMFAFFSFLHTTSYEVTFVRCENQQIIISKEQENTEITLFNIEITDEKGWEYIQTLLQKAKKIQIEIDPSTKLEEPLSVYLFVDQELLQEILLKKGYAKIAIRNPEYTYEKQMEEANQTVAASANPTHVSGKKGYAIVAPIFLGLVCAIWILMFLYMVFKYRKKKTHKLQRKLKKNSRL